MSLSIWWRQPRVYLRALIYLAIVAVIWFKLMPVLRIGKLPLEANLTDMVEGYFHAGVRAEAGMKYLSIGFYLEADGSGEIELSEDRFRLVGRSGRAYAPVEGSLELPDLAEDRWRYEPGDVCPGRVVFLVPEDAQPSRLSINPPRKSPGAAGE